ncbi:1174_t:CDS:1 [Funneliformis caledonium]|uniref:1174_t:CDS:1 n=1 Tax=Funneliformis caledonium TaxID=1117310 RepID=A0A9N9INK0_9GLOM|nr:1174_t:CDS:1 [Funneliformis caledonium]
MSTKENLPFVHTWVIKDFQHFYDKQNLLRFIISEPFNSPFSINSSNETNLEYTWRLIVDIENIREDISLYIVALQTDFERKKNANDRISVFEFKVFKNQYGNKNLVEELGTLNKISFIHKTRFGIKNAHGGKLCKIDQLLPNNNTSIRTDIIIRAHIIEPERVQLNDFNDNNTIPPLLLSPSLEQFFNNPHFSDVIFTFDCGSELSASRLVLAAKSTYFMNMFSGAWLESNQSRIVIKGSKYEYYRELIYYFYNGSLGSDLDFDVLKGLFNEANMCQIEDLVRIVANRIVKMISNEIWHEILLMGWRFNNNDLKEGGLKYVYENWMNIKDTENMKFIIENLNVECMEELMAARFFGVGK